MQENNQKKLLINKYYGGRFHLNKKFYSGEIFNHDIKSTYGLIIDYCEAGRIYYKQKSALELRIEELV